MHQNYIMLTVVKNENKYIRQMAESIIWQNIRPKLWLVVDDNSEDSTDKYISHLAKRYKWIKTMHLTNDDKRDITFHYAELCILGFNLLEDYARKNEISWGYIALVDGDMVLEQNYFEFLMHEFSHDPLLGIASGELYCRDGKNLIQEPAPQDLPKGSPRFWTKECFEVSKYIRTYSPDSVSNVKARLHGWKTKNFKGIKAIHLRRTSSFHGLWRGYYIQGASCYFIGFHPLHICLKSMKLVFQKPYYIGIAFFIGYFQKLCLLSEKIKDKEIRTYNWNRRLFDRLTVNIKNE
jgi:glycosyltransferase involved in cell wall biosynthesis